MSSTPPSSDGKAPGAGTGPSQAGTGSSSGSNTATPGAFARRFPGIHSTFTRYSNTAPGRFAATAWKRRRPIAFGLFATYGLATYTLMALQARKRDHIHDGSWLVIKVYPGAIVEAKETPTLATYLYASSAGEDRPRVMELFELVRAINLAGKDQRIKGIFGDFSGIHVPRNVNPEPLGLAQIEEIVTALHSFRTAKQQQFIMEKLTEKLNASSPMMENQEQLLELTQTAIGMLQGQGPPARLDRGKQGEATSVTTAVSQDKDKDRDQNSLEVAKETNTAAAQEMAAKVVEDLQAELKDVEMPPTTIAWADSFDSQGAYLMASAFEKVYLQPSGDVPLMGLRSSTEFYKRALDWLGIKVFADARRDYKSFVAPFVQADGFTEPQLEDRAALLGELSRSVAYSLGVNRFPDMEPSEAADKIMELSKNGPYGAREATELGLISGVMYKRHVIKELGEQPELRTLKSYSKIMDRIVEKKLTPDQLPKIAVVYLRDTISDAPGEFSASTAIRGLKEAGEDEDVTAVILRIDSGGGSALTSDTIWDAVMRVREEYGKPVIASFGNVSASGGYFAASAADYILASESTITGSIGVASLRPHFTLPFFDRIGLRLQTLFTGSNMFSAIHELSDKDKKKWQRYTDATYEQFLEKVCDGRSISRDVVESLADGRVWTGYKAYMRFRPEDDEETDKIEEMVSDGKDAQRGSVKEADESDSVVSKNAKPYNPDVIVQWGLTDVAREGEMSTFRIVPGAKMPALKDKKPVKKVESKAADEDETSITDSIQKIIDQEEGSKATAPGKPDAPLSEDEEANLAVAAHEAAQESQKEEQDANADKNGKNETKEYGPYGRGLVDGLGGLLDAGLLAINLGVQREIEALIKTGMTPEQAMASVRPGAPREIDAEGNAQLVMDLKLTRFPVEKGFRERVRELNRYGDKPNLSLFFPGLGHVGTEIKAWLAETAVQLLASSWSDPAFVRRVMLATEREQMRQQGVRMESDYNVRF